MGQELHLGWKEEGLNESMAEKEKSFTLKENRFQGRERANKKLPEGRCKKRERRAKLSKRTWKV